MIDTVTELTHKPREQITNFIDLMRNRKLVIEEPGGVAFFVRVDDATLEQIRENKVLLTDPVSMEKLIFSEGDNIHIIGLVLNVGNNIFSGLRRLIERENPKSISWWSEYTNRFIYRRLLW